MTKEEDILNFLSVNVFEPILNSKSASRALNAGVRTTIYRLKQRDARGMVDYFWSAIKGTERSIKFAERMEKEGFIRFEEVLPKFRKKFGDAWLRSKA